MTRCGMAAFFFSAVFLLCSVAPSEEGAAPGFVVPEIPEGEESTYRVTFLDKEEKSFAIDGDLAQLEEFTYTFHSYNENGMRYFKVNEVERLPKGLRNEFCTIFEVDSYMRMLRYTETMYSYTGKVIRDHSSDYDDPFYELPEPVILTHVITFWLRGVDFDVGAAPQFHLMLLGDSSPPWRMWARVGPIEEVQVPAGRFQCYKVTIVPDLHQIFGKWAWISFAIRPLIPDFFIWYDVKPPHPMVKFEGALGVKGITAVQVHELASYKTPGKTRQDND